MKSMWQLTLAAVLAWAAGIGWGGAFAAEATVLSLIQDGKSKCAIVIPDAPTPQEKLAGEELAKYLKQISGAELAVKSESTGQKIVVAQAKDGKGPAGISFTKEEADYDAFVIKTDGQYLYLVGSNKRAVLYAVYTFLEKHLGCRWLTLGERSQTEEEKKTGAFRDQIEEYVPASRTITLPAIDDRQKASLKYRGFTIYAWFGNTPMALVDWATKNKLNYFWIQTEGYVEAKGWHNAVVKGGMIPRGFILSVGNSSFYYFLNPDKYFKDHPDWFAMIGGKRVPGGRTKGQFCLSNPEAVKTFRENFRAFVKEHPEVDIFSPGPNDEYFWCECELCAKDRIMWKERPGENQPAPQDLYTAFANQLNEDVQKLYPGQGKRFGIMAYQCYTQPPAKTKPPAGAFISYCFFTRNWHTVPWGNAKGEVAPGPFPIQSHTDSNRRGYQLHTDNVKQWIELTKPSGGDVIADEFYCGRSSWEKVGFYLMSLISDELAYFMKIGVTGCIVQEGWDWRKVAPANCYVFAKNCWDTSLSTDAILADYAKARFGKAAGPMLKYLHEAERNSREFLKDFAYGKKDQRDKSLEDCQNYLDEAKALVDTDQAKKNFADEEANFKRLKAWQLSKGGANK
ncbi:MAG: DUF4838 domain-containing protein [Kiritimatiellae bacterium]|nr:DUF4838 domain-containing protein [Verrucomicrobiota bacterium]MBU4289601.1 DUF4838 domain-containing protein [Verrucomicrobiota bacterium]MCG2678743.1 DUF4838 domain-containing protein [Kiritimatiellia bacterium]